jgi:hypothetical protein
MPTLKVDTEALDKRTIKDVIGTYVYEYMGPLSEKGKDAAFSKILDVFNQAQAIGAYDAKADPALQLKEVEVSKESLHSMLTRIVNDYYAGEDPIVLDMWAHELVKDLNEFIVVLDKEAGK